MKWCIVIVHLIVRVLERTVACKHLFSSQSFKSSLNEFKNGSSPRNGPKSVVYVAVARHAFAAAG